MTDPDTPLLSILLVPHEGKIGPGDLFGVGGWEAPTAWNLTYPDRPHAETWEDTSCPVSLCTICGQPWPCDTPDAVEPASTRWFLGRSHSQVSIVLAWHGKLVAPGCDHADWLLHGLLTEPATVQPEVRCAAAVVSALAGGGGLGWLEDRFSPLGEIITISR